MGWCPWLFISGNLQQQILLTNHMQFPADQTVISGKQGVLCSRIILHVLRIKWSTEEFHESKRVMRWN